MRLRSSANPYVRSGAVPIEDLPREQTLILQNPEGAINNPGWFNIWVNGGGGSSTGLHQLMMDTLWYIDPDAGIDGVTHNSLASGPPVYNDDFTEMTVNLRDDIYWSDGEQFTADDVVFTVQTQIDTPGMDWSGAFSTQVETVEAVDDQTVHFTLQAPNSRFHSIFSVRWEGAWIMPEHIFSGVENVLEYDFADPVGLGPYVLHSYDPQRQLVHLGEARGLGPHFGCRLRRAGAAVRHLPQQHADRQSADRDAQRRSGRDPRPLAGGHVLDRRGGGHGQGLVPRVPVRPSRSHAADVHLQPSEREVPGSAACAGRSR